MDSRLVLAFILISSLGFSGAFWLGGSSNDGTVRFHKGSQFGFEKNPQIYSHLVIPPWNRPFKPGYCASWEWHTDKKYRDKRVAICKQYTEGKYRPQFCLFFFLRSIWILFFNLVLAAGHSHSADLQMNLTLELARKKKDIYLQCLTNSLRYFFGKYDLCKLLSKA